MEEIDINSRSLTPLDQIMNVPSHNEPCFLEPSMPFDELLEWAPGADYETLSVCKANPDHRQSRARRPLKVVAPLAPTTDFLWTVYKECLVTEKVRDTLLRCNLAGLDFRPVIAFATSGFETHVELYELFPLGWGGMVHRDSQISLSERCPSCGRTVYSTVGEGRIVFDVDAWDGSDLFRVWPLPVFKCISPSFSEVVERQQWTGCRFLAFEGLKPNLSGKISPGVVTSWVEGARGREIQAQIDAELSKRYPQFNGKH